MMKRLLIAASLLLGSANAHSQTKASVDSLIEKTLRTVHQYDCRKYANEKIHNEDVIAYDTAYFYRDRNGRPVYLLWKRLTHTFHITGDKIGITELFFMNNNAVYKRSYDYNFVNPQWDKEPSMDETAISMTESLREYYREDGSALGGYRSRTAEGKYRERWSLLDTIALTETLKRRWSARCDRCIEEEYLRIYRTLIDEKRRDRQSVNSCSP